MSSALVSRFNAKLLWRTVAEIEHLSSGQSVGCLIGRDLEVPGSSGIIDFTRAGNGEAIAPGNQFFLPESEA